MKKYREVVAGDEVTIFVVEHEDDLDGFRDFVRSHLKVLAVDTETTGVQMYAPDFKVRLAQFGTPDEAWVIPVEHGGRFVEDVRRALLGVGKLIFHNGVFDLQVIDKHFGIRMEDLWPKVHDTQILAKLIDPRAPEKGGIGNALEDVTRHYISAEIADGVKSFMRELAKEYKTTKEKVFSKVDLFNPKYNVYAGMDVILAARLLSKQIGRVPASAKKLSGYEHKVAEVCSYMQRQGFLLDVEYTEKLSERLLHDEALFMEKADSFGVENVNSTEQVADGLERMGVRIVERTPSGKRKVDKVLLARLVEEGNELAIAVKEAKKAGKWRKTWVETFLNTRDQDDRCHASINTLQARTGRMSITGIPAQTLPSGDWMIRRCFLADPGQVVGSIDYQAQELRVLAALSGDKTMIKAFEEGADLHQITADSANVDRKVGKTTNFQKVYGGGADALAKAVGIPIWTAQAVHKSFDKTYPGVKTFSNRLQNEARRNGCVVTPNGRVLPVDQDRPYAALNYMIQSTSRDVTCRGILRLHKAGFTPYLRLPIHDEVLASLPEARAEWGAQQIAKHMAEQMGPVFIGTDPEVGGRSWGSLYGADF